LHTFLNYLYLLLVKGLKREEAVLLVKERNKGRPTVLSQEVEDSVADILRVAVFKHRIPISLSYVKLVVKHQIVHAYGVGKYTKMIRSCGGDKWFRGFQNRYPDLGYKERKRAIETHHARKAQPEVTVKWYWILLHTYTLMQIHRRIAEGTFIFLV
jgi:hypothetical protein